MDWRSVGAADFRSDSVKEGEQAELLVEERYAWTLIQRIGVRNEAMRERVLEELDGAEIYRAPRSWAEKALGTLIHRDEVDKGGPFAAWEQPQLFSEQVRAAFRSLH